MDSTQGAPVAWPAIVELRQYTLRPGQRDTLVNLFDAEFVESQERLGASVIGQFRDLGDPDRFVWLRGFSDMNSRKEALAAFYGGPVWKAHRETANPTMLDSDNVLLLRPSPRAVSHFPAGRRPGTGSPVPGSMVTASVYSFGSAPHPAAVDLINAGAVAGSSRSLVVLETEPAENTFPRLPIREGEHVIVRLERFDSDDALSAHREGLLPASALAGDLADLGSPLLSAPQELRLRPTSRSLLR
jgi:NIPSNAP